MGHTEADEVADSLLASAPHLHSRAQAVAWVKTKMDETYAVVEAVATALFIRQVLAG